MQDPCHDRESVIWPQQTAQSGSFLPPGRQRQTAALPVTAANRSGHERQIPA